MFCSKEHMSHKKTERRLRDLPSVQFFPPHPFSHSHVYEPSLFTHTLPTLHGLESHSSTSALKKRLWNVSTWIFNYIWIHTVMIPKPQCQKWGIQSPFDHEHFCKNKYGYKKPVLTANTFANNNGYEAHLNCEFPVPIIIGIKSLLSKRTFPL